MPQKVAGALSPAETCLFEGRLVHLGEGQGRPVVKILIEVVGFLVDLARVFGLGGTWPRWRGRRRWGRWRSFGVPAAPGEGEPGETEG